MKGSKYSILPRFDFLRTTSSFSLDYYMREFEVSRRTVFRDIEVLKDIYDIDYCYDRFTKRFEKVV